jgi:DGQHR domain-containing protein
MLAIYNQLRHHEALECYAILGQENNRQVVTFNLSYTELVEFFKPVPYDENSDLLLQRETQKSRVNAICDYTKVDYAALPSCGAILEDFTIEETSLPSIVKLTIPAGAFRYLFDGQGRRGGIEKLLNTHPEFSSNDITIKGFKTEGVTRDNQLFSDFNGASSKPNKSICQSMDSRTLINTFTKEILKSDSMHLINKRVDYTKASVTLSQSPKLWSLNQFNAVVQTILGVTPKSAEKLLVDESKRQFWTGFVVKYFNELLNAPAIESAIATDNGVVVAKTETVIGTAVWIKGMAVVGRVIAMHLMQNTEPGTKADWSFMSALDAVDFTKSNTEWIGRCMDFRGRFQDKGFNHKAMAAYLLAQLGLALPEELEVIEDEVLVAKSEQRKAEREAKQAQTKLEEVA